MNEEIRKMWDEFKKLGKMLINVLRKKYTFEEMVDMERELVSNYNSELTGVNDSLRGR